jgi:hypothetical protein
MDNIEYKIYFQFQQQRNTKLSLQINTLYQVFTSHPKNPPYFEVKKAHFGAGSAKKMLISLSNQRLKIQLIFFLQIMQNFSVCEENESLSH